MTNPLILLTAAALLGGCTLTADKQAETTAASAPEGIEYDQPSNERGHHFTRDFSGGKVYGQGPYRYRLVLQVPLIDGPDANQPYALSHERSRFFLYEQREKSLPRHHRSFGPHRRVRI